MKSFVLSQTSTGLSLFAHRLGHRGPRVLLLGGVHGDEVEGVALTRELLGRYVSGGLPYKLEMMVIPVLNVEGLLAQTRHNSSGVDLNRNLPTKDWTPQVHNPRYCSGSSPNSELENQALTQVIEDFKPIFIFTFHSFSRWMININGDCQREGGFLGELTSYPVHADIGYPTPGSLGTYAAWERGIPTITYELKRGQDLKTLLPPHIRAVDQCLQLIERTRAP